MKTRVSKITDMISANHLEIKEADDIGLTERQNLLTRLLDAVKQCQVRFGGRSELATDGDSRVSCLCSAWEAVLQHGLKHNNKALSAFKQVTEMTGLSKMAGVFGDIKNLETEPVFWLWVKEHLNRHEIQRYSNLRHITTDSGKGRAWLRAAINEHSLERYLHIFMENVTLISQFYEDWAFVKDEERSSMMPMMAAGLGSILFAISIDRSELNAVRQPSLSVSGGNSFPSPYISEPLPVIAGDIHEPANERKKERKKKRRVANIVSFDDDDCTISSASPSSVLSPSLSTASDLPSRFSFDQETENSQVNGEEIVPVEKEDKRVRFQDEGLRKNAGFDVGGVGNVVCLKDGSFEIENECVFKISVGDGCSGDDVCDRYTGKVLLGDNEEVIEEGHLQDTSNMNDVINNGNLTDTDIIVKGAGVVKSSYDSGSMDDNAYRHGIDGTAPDNVDVTRNIEADNLNTDLLNIIENDGMSSKRDVMDDKAETQTGMRNDDVKDTAFNDQDGESRTLPANNYVKTIDKFLDEKKQGRPSALSNVHSHGHSDNGIVSSNNSKPSSQSNHEQKNTSLHVSFNNRQRVEAELLTPINESGQMEDFSICADIDGSNGSNIETASVTTVDSVDVPVYEGEEVETASVALLMAQTGYSRVLHSESDALENCNIVSLNKSMSIDELKQAVITMMMRKDEVEEQNVSLKTMLNQEIEVSSMFRAEVDDLKVKIATLQEKDHARFLALQKENELLKHQLRKYVSAVQLLRTQSGNGSSGSEGSLGIHLDTIQPSIPPAPSNIDYSNEAIAYEKKLIQVAEMHGELMEFNEMLHRKIIAKDALIGQLQDDLVQLRGPLNVMEIGFEEDLLDGVSPQSRALINIWIPSAFLRGSAAGTHHVYQVYTRVGDQEWNIYRRYSEFLLLFKMLKKNYPIMSSYEFPAKKVLRNKDSRLVEQRRIGFQNFLRQAINYVLMNNAELVNNIGRDQLIAVIPFFGDNKPSSNTPSRPGHTPVARPVGVGEGNRTVSVTQYMGL